MKGADLIKFLLSLVVVWIHAGDSTLWGLTAWAVPVFFLFSGFFLFGKVFQSPDDKASSIVTTWWKKTLRLYLVWTFIFVPFSVYGFYQDGLPLWKGALVWGKNVLFRGENYLSWPLWYLLGLLHAGAVIWLFAKLKLPFRCLCITAAIFWAVPKLIDLNSIKAWTMLMRTTGDGFTVGLPFLVLGAVFRKLFPGIFGWPKESPFYKPALTLRFFSIHIYLTHMLWAGLLFILTSIPRGLLLWLIVIAIALITGYVVHKFPSIEKALYGKSF